jgi:hypothetical protein
MLQAAKLCPICPITRSLSLAVRWRRIQENAATFGSETKASKSAPRVAQQLSEGNLADCGSW